MSGLAKLSPCVDPTVLWPANAVFMARTTLERMRMLGVGRLTLDSVTTHLMGILGDRPTVRHRSGATDEILAFLHDAGLTIAEDMRLFGTAEEAWDLADALVSEGKRLFWPYPLPRGRFAEDANLVRTDLWERLNSKEYLGEIVPDGALPPRAILSTRHLGADRALPVVVKAGGVEATGWGYAVHFCRTPECLDRVKRTFLAEGIGSSIVESALQVACSWCVNLAISEAGVTYLGAAEQLFSAPGRQAGSLVDPDNALPDAGIELARSIGEVARRRGFRGVAGLDIGRVADGRLIVFDPNFRFNASTAQVLLHPAAARRSGLGVSRSFAVAVDLPAASVLDRLRFAVEEGWFVPTRIVDPRWSAEPNETTMVNGFVMGRDRPQAARRCECLEQIFAS